jgi:1,4-dihydroxy-2-naphthoate octaprenyltransferase
MPSLSAWLQAARPLAAANVAFPLMLGQALAYAAGGEFSWSRFGTLQLLGVFQQLFIVFANDVADVDADELHPRPSIVSGGSRVLQEGKLTITMLRRAAWLGLALALLVALGLALADALWWMPALVLVGAALLWAYSFPPLRLSYRGHGESLQGLGVGVVLPIVGFYGQAGSFAGLPWLGLIPCFLLGWAGNVLTSLPDYLADKRADKRSYPVRRNQFEARRHALELSALAVALGVLVVPGLPWWALSLLLAAPALPLFFAMRLLGTADAGNDAECLRFVLLGAAVGNVAMLGWMIAAVLQRWLA